MFTNFTNRSLILSLLFAAGALNAQTVTNVIDTFNPSAYPNGTVSNKWSNWFGGAFQSLSLDPASDANGNPNSGSLKIVANFPTNTDQFEVWNGINGFSPAINGFQFTNFQCDVRFAAGSATNSSGYFGSLQFGVPTPGYGQDYFSTSVNIPSSNTNWVHVSINLNPNTDTNLQSMIGLLIHIWGAGIKGPSTLWVDNLQFVGSASSGTATINYTNTAQRIDGFGASSAWSSGTLPTNVADMFFSTNSGIGLSFLRTHIAPDGTTTEGNIAQQAQARGARVWSTPWSPPVIYKNTNTVNGGSFSNSAANYQGYAAQLASYAVSMTNTYGVPLYAISVQNEPDISTSYESCLWTAQQFHDFIPYLYTNLVASNVAYVKILFPESSGWSSNPGLQTTAMSDPNVAPLVGIIANHDYDGSTAAITNWGKPLWETEVSTFDAFDGGITNGLYWAGRIHSLLTVAQANAWHFWWLHAGSDNEGLADGSYNPTKRMYALGHWSKFVRPNFYRIGVANTAVALVSAFKDPASSNFVIVAANNSAFPVNQTFTLTNFPVVGPLRQWVTSGTESLANHGGAVSVTNNTFAVTLAPWSMTTFVYQPPVTNSPTIWQQPVSLLALPGDLVSFSAQASGGTAPLFYQWFFNGTNGIAGATNATLVLNNANLTNAGNYFVVVTNYAGSVTSSVASLTFNTIVWSAPVTIAGAADIATNGTSLYAFNNSGGSASVNSVTFTGVSSYTAWGTGVTLGSAWSAATTSAFVGGSSPPWSNLPGGYQTILQGGAWNNGGLATVTLNNLFTGHQYQVQVWVNDSRSGGTTNRTETLLGASGSTVTLAYNSTYAQGGVGQYTIGTFTATATNQSFTMNSGASTQINALQVRDVTLFAPSIVQQPTNQGTWLGSNVTFAVNASGTAPLSYQWLFNGTNNLPSATNANLTLTSLAVSNAGNYSVWVTNIAGSITSAVASLTISSDANFVLKTDDAPGGSSFNAIGNWTNSATGAAATFAPTSSYTYRTGPFALRTPATAGNYTFAGGTLTVSAGGNLNIQGGSGNLVTLNNLLLAGTVNNTIGPNALASIAGNMTVLGGALNASSASGDTRAITNAMTMTGSGALTNYGLGYVVYTGNNAAFTGPVIVTNTVLQIAAQANLGGNPASFNAGQLTLDNGTLQPTASFALKNPNSGVTLGSNGGTFNLGAGITLTISNQIAGAGALVKTGPGSLALAATNPLTGTLAISNGTLSLSAPAGATSLLPNVPMLTIASGATLDVSAVTSGFRLNSGQTLRGSTGSTVNGNLTVGSGATIAPGGNNTPQVLTASSNVTFLAGSTNAMQVNKQTGTNDLLLVGGTLTFGGTLQLITNGAAALAAGDSFTLFNAGSLAGNFARVAGSPGAGLGYYFNPSSGVLKVVAAGFDNPTNLTATIAGSTMTISWPPTHLGWFLQAQTNSLTSGLGANWFDLPGSDTNTQAVIYLVPTNPTVFYRLRHP